MAHLLACVAILLVTGLSEVASTVAVAAAQVSSTRGGSPAARESLALLQAQLDEMLTNGGGQVQQAAACRISSKDLLATAETTARGVLHGVCNPREIEDRLHNLESQVADQFNVIKTMLLNIEDKLAQQETQYQKANRKLHGAVAELTESIQSCATNKPVAGEATDQAVPRAPAAPSQPAGPSTGNRLQSSGSTQEGVPSTGANPDDEEESINPRQDEIDHFNSSIHLESGKRVFSYYWQVGDMEYKLKSWGQRRSLRSPSFYIFTYGYMMYLRMYPRQNGQNVYIHVGLTKGEYDEALEWPFTLKHRITVIDQAHPPYQDIVSRVWDPRVLCSAWNWKRPMSGDNYECVGLGFPHDDLRAHSFIRDDTFIVKLTVFLD